MKDEYLIIVKENIKLIYEYIKIFLNVDILKS